MDDLSATIGAILNDPQKMEQLRSVAQSLGINAPLAQSPPAAQDLPQTGGGGFDPAAFASMLQGISAATGGVGSQPQPQPQQQAPPQESAAANSLFGGLNFGAFSTISDVMKEYNKKDKNTDLLRSLKPHFSETRATRVDDAIKLVQLVRVWPVIRDSGLLSNLGSLGNLGGILGGGVRK